jgi:hypothetical protein
MTLNSLVLITFWISSGFTMTPTLQRLAQGKIKYFESVVIFCLQAVPIYHILPWGGAEDDGRDISDREGEINWQENTNSYTASQ